MDVTSIKSQFDHCDSIRSWIRNGQLISVIIMKNADQRLLQLGYKHESVDSGTIVNYNDFKRVYSLFRFDISKNESNIHRSGSAADIEIKLLLDQLPAFRKKSNHGSQ